MIKKLLTFCYWESEELYFSLPSNNLLINKKELSFKDLDGQTMLLYKNIGFWKERVLKHMPHTHFIIENNRHDFLKLLDHSDFVCFTTDLAIEEGILKNRVIKEISNPEALVPFYICCLEKNNKKYTIKVLTNKPNWFILCLRVKKNPNINKKGAPMETG